MVQDEYGEAEDVLRLDQIDRPAIADADVLVHVAQAQGAALRRPASRCPVSRRAGFARRWWRAGRRPMGCSAVVKAQD
jgi:hypothetical protein